ncbi:hypothetical protein [Deinococcus aluminii]|uniref:TFIIB-type zinc ribbon-containing protein n=1 Tax=Deinococcus aluminii TaxID=1656885 RepID=A0ABP9XEL5_9DEIO
MSSVIDTTACPHCGGTATTDFQTRTGFESVWCERCGYWHDPARGQEARAPLGVLTLRVQASVATQTCFLDQGTDLDGLRAKVLADETLTQAALRLAPHYRTEFLHGEPQGGRGAMPPEIWDHLTAALAPFEELPHALVEHTLYTRHPDQRGYRVFTCWQSEGTHRWEVSLPGDEPTVLMLSPAGAFPLRDFASALHSA